jgi:hypothetical protein
MKIDFQKAVIAGVAGTILFDLAGFALTGVFWDVPALLGAKLFGEDGFIPGVIAHYGNGVALAVIYAGLAPSFRGNDFVRSLTYITAQTVVGVYFFMFPLLGLGVFGYKTGFALAGITLVRHWAYAVALAWLYPVTERPEVHLVSAPMKQAA